LAKNYNPESFDLEIFFREAVKKKEKKDREKEEKRNGKR